VEQSAVRTWTKPGLLHAKLTGDGRFFVDLDQTAAMVVEYPRGNVDERIRQLIESTPEFKSRR
jgi:hypothetical protein